MKNNGKCPKCGSSDLIKEARVVSNEGGIPDHDVQARVDADPSAMFFMRSAHSRLHAYICSQCGYTEIYAMDVEDLSRAYLESQQQPRK